MAEWQSSRFGESYAMELAPALQLQVIREMGTRDGPSPPYRVVVFGATLKARHDDREQAKSVAIDVARKWLARATLALG